jgi:hypothetical protein
MKKILLFFSILFSAPITAIFLTFLFSRACQNFLQPFIFGVFAFSFVPIIVAVYYYRKGLVDIEVSERKKRTPIYLVSILSQIFAVFYFYYGCRLMLFLSLAFLLNTIAVFLINLKYKISAHAGNIAGIATILYLIYGNIALPIYLLLIPIYALRIKLKAHTIGQLILGTISSIILTYVAYKLIF